MLRATVKGEKIGFINKESLVYYFDEAIEDYGDDFFEEQRILIQDSESGKVIDEIKDVDDWEYYQEQPAVDVSDMSLKAFENYLDSSYVVDNDSESCKIYDNKVNKSNFVTEVSTATELNKFFEEE